MTTTLDRFAEVVGADHVRVDDADFRDPFPLGTAAQAVPAAVVAPGSVEEIQAVVRVANETGIPLWTVSTGRNLSYGGASPRVAGSVVVELTRMDQILEVNEEGAYALLEPGVRFFDLYERLRTDGGRLWPSVADLGWGSVVGNALDRGIGYTPYGEHSSMQCGMEVVLANGDLVRTGMGAMTGSASWQLYKPGFGPSWDGIFQQSNYGIVTKMGIWLMPAPETWLVGTLTVPRFEDLADLIDTLRPLCIDRTFQGEITIAEPLVMAAQLKSRDAWYDGDGPTPDSVTEQIMRELGLGRWNMTFALYGREQMVDVQLSTVREAFAGIEGARLESTKYPGDVDHEQVEPWHRVYGGIAGMVVLPMLDWRGTPGGHAGFSPVSPLNGRDALAQSELFRRRAHEYGVDYMGAFSAHGGARYMHHIVELIFKADDADQVRRVRELFAALVPEAAVQGYGEYRTHVEFMDLVADQLDWGDHALRRLNHSIKDALDPGGILSPGKSGIWPARMRAGSNNWHD